MKADSDLAKIPVVMVTFVHDAGMGASLGAADYLTKPVHWDKLKAVMDRFRDAEGDVLIVDDDADARERLRVVLERNGWTTQEAANGRDAMAHVIAAVPRVDPARSHHAGDGWLQLPARTPRTSGLRGCAGDRADGTRLVRHRSDAIGDRDRVLSKGSVSLNDITRELRAVAPPLVEAGQGADIAG